MPAKVIGVVHGNIYVSKIETFQHCSLSDCKCKMEGVILMVTLILPQHSNIWCGHFSKINV